MSERTVTKEEKEKLRALAGQATAGKWYVCGPPWGSSGIVLAGSDDPHVGTYVCNTDDELMFDEVDERGSLNTVNDAEYIAAASPETVLALLEENTRQREWMEKVEIVLLALDGNAFSPKDERDMIDGELRDELQDLRRELKGVLEDA